jgi:hypothetical protein
LPIPLPRARLRAIGAMMDIMQRMAVNWRGLAPVVLLITLSVVAAGACGVGANSRTEAAGLSATQEIPQDVARRRAELAKELKPVTLSNCEPVRVGSANDGGYAMCGNLLAGITAAYSYGIGGNDDWGCQMSTTHKIPVHQYDCFTPESAPCARGNMRLNVECVGPKTESKDGRAFDTLARQIARNGDTGKKMVVKMDIEGAEWQSILAAPDSLFASIVQMPMELHGVDAQEVLAGVRKLKRHFYLVSVHFNNFNCSDEYRPFANFAYQVLLVNKKVGVPGPPKKGVPPIESALAPDNKNAPECKRP